MLRVQTTFSLKASTKCRRQIYALLVTFSAMMCADV